MKQAQIRALRTLFDTLANEAKELRAQKRTMPKTSFRHTILCGRIEGLMDAQANINRLVRKLNKGEEI